MDLHEECHIQRCFVEQVICKSRPQRIPPKWKKAV